MALTNDFNVQHNSVLGSEPKGRFMSQWYSDDSTDDYGELEISRRIRESENDDTHPSMDADMDMQEMYDLGYV